MGTGLSMRLAAEASERGLDVERLQTKFGVHTAQGAGGDFLVIPYRRGGEIRNRKYRTSLVAGQGGGKNWQDGREKKAIRLLYNEDALRNTKLRGQPVIITEGEPDLWALDLAGYERIVGWPDGAPEVSIPVGEESPKYQPLDDAIATGLFTVENMGGTADERAQVPIIIAADGDEAGTVLLYDLSVRLGRSRCKFLTYPLSRKDRGRARCKDLGEVLEDYGTAGVVKTIERAQWVACPGVYRMSELSPRPKPQAYDIGIPLLRDSFRMRRGDWSVVTGIPGMGKTTLVSDICNRVIEEYSTNENPIVVTVASFEQEPQIDHKRNLMWWVNSKHPAKQTVHEIEYAESWIDHHYRFLVPEENDDISVEWVLENLATAVTRDGSQIAVIDPWNEMDHVRQPGEQMTDYVGRSIKAFRRFARVMNVHLMVVAHPTKMQQRQDGSFPMPTLYSVSDSAHWFNKADAGIIVHQEEKGSIIWVQKSRYHDEIGIPRMYDAIYSAGERRFEVTGVHHRGDA